MTASGFYVFNSGNSFGILEGQKDENNMKKIQLLAFQNSKILSFIYKI